MQPTFPSFLLQVIMDKNCINSLLLAQAQTKITNENHNRRSACQRMGFDSYARHYIFFQQQKQSMVKSSFTYMDIKYINII
jgi:hypothetical protein